MDGSRWPHRLCFLLCGLLAACSQNKGPATSAYVRGCGSLEAKLGERLAQLPSLAPPSRPILAKDPTAEQQRVYDGLSRLYPLYVNQFDAAVIERCKAISQVCSQALDSIGALDAAGVDPAGVQAMTLIVQRADQRRDFIDEVRKLADLSQTALVHRRSVDEADELLIGVFGAALSGEYAAVVLQAKEAAAAVARRQAEPYGVGDQLARVAESAGRLAQGGDTYATERARLLADLGARFPGQDWGDAKAATAAH